MVSAFAKGSFDDDLQEVLQAEEAKRLKIERRGDLDIWITAHPIHYPKEEFTARMLWPDYPGHLPSVLFVDPGTGALGVGSAWPVMRGCRPPNDICASWTLEGHNQHPEWRGTWNKSGNILLASVRYYQQELDTTFEKRFGT